MEKTTNTHSDATTYAAFIGRHVIAYYRDPRGTDRKMHGFLKEVRGNNLFLEFGEWSGVLNCKYNQVSLVSTVDGWRKQEDALEFKEQPARPSFLDRLRKL